MNATFFPNSARSGWQGAALTLALIAAGLAGNYFKYPIFLNIDFLFGSIFALLILQFFGPVRGVVAAALISALTYLLWHHPYAILIMTAEVAAVAWLMHRYKIGLVLADALYWLLIGMPLVYVFYHGVMAVPVGNTTIVMTKQAVNGISNALVARLIFTGIAIIRRDSKIAYRDIIYNLLAFFALWPALMLLMIASRSDFEEIDHNIRTDLARSSQVMTSRLDIWVQGRATAVSQLADLAASLTAAQMQARLEQARASDVNFLRIGMRSPDSTVTAYSPPIDEFGQPNVGKKLPERPYIPRLRQTLRPMLAEVVMGRIDTPKPVAILLAPIVKSGAYAGYINAVLRLDQIRDSLEMSAERNAMLYTLIDRKGNIILSNRQEQKLMAPLERGPGNLTRLDAGISQWLPIMQENIPISERWKSSLYVSERPVGQMAEWRLILEQPVAPFQKMLYARYADGLGLLFLILLAALALAEFLSRRVVAATEQLSELAQDLPSRLESGGQIAWPESALLEPHRLMNNFKQMTETLAAQLTANRQLNATLEKRVEQRTRELGVSVEELRRSNADLEQFAYAASHDMRQPLRMITSYLQLLAAELQPHLNDETREHFHFASEGAQRMDQMMAALLDYSRVGRSTEVMDVVDSSEVLADALRILQPAVAAADALVRVEGDWSSGPKIYGNRDELLRLFQNLIDNALKYRREEHRQEVIVTVTRTHGEWRFAVTDNGVGLLPGQDERLFKVFERLQPRSRYPGTGIGLALCRKIVEHHGGRIWAESAGENQGCSFIFTLPSHGAG